MKAIIPLAITVIVLCLSCHERDQPTFNPELEAYCRTLPGEFADLPDSTRKLLEEAGDYIIEHLNAGKKTRISFVCEHNSRKSHLGHVWTNMALLYYGIEDVKCFSGGTTPTYVNQRIITALENAGFDISEKGIVGHGPKYYLDYGNAAHGFEIYSKRYDHPMNPDTNYLAITLCYNPEECCPISGGADLQLSIPYQDMQPYDNTALEEEMYDKQCRQVAMDMFYMVDFVKQNTGSMSR